MWNLHLNKQTNKKTRIKRETSAGKPTGGRREARKGDWG
jgi:hypothetical protein